MAIKKKGLSKVSSPSAAIETKPEITPEFMALVLFKQDLGASISVLTEEFKVSYSQIKSFRLARLTNPLVLMHYNDLMQGFKSEWLCDGSQFMKKALLRLTELIEQSNDIREVARAVEIVGTVMSDNHIAFASGTYMLSKIADPKLIHPTETVETFEDVLEVASQKITEETLKQYELEHLKEDYVESGNPES